MSFFKLSCSLSSATWPTSFPSSPVADRPRGLDAHRSESSQGRGQHQRIVVVEHPNHSIQLLIGLFAEEGDCLQRLKFRPPVGLRVDDFLAISARFGAISLGSNASAPRGTRFPVACPVPAHPPPGLPLDYAEPVPHVVGNDIRVPLIDLWRVLVIGLATSAHGGPSSTSDWSDSMRTLKLTSSPVFSARATFALWLGPTVSLNPIRPRVLAMFRRVS